MEINHMEILKLISADKHIRPDRQRSVSRATATRPSRNGNRRRFEPAYRGF